MNTNRLRNLSKSSVAFLLTTIISLGGMARADVWDDALPVYRFWSDLYGGHFFTLSEPERDNVILTMPAWAYEGGGWHALQYAAPGASPVHRFWSDEFLGHFFTISEAEKDYVIANLDEWRYEGVAWYAFDAPDANTQPIYRFWSDVYQSHFYTQSIAERDYVIANLAEWAYEGVAWHAPMGTTPPSDPPQTPDDVMQLQLLRLVNQARSTGYDCGPEGVFESTHPLSWNEALAKAATRHSTDMAENDFFEHTGSDGSTVWDRALDQGYNYTAIGENIAAGQETAQEVHAGWLSSPGHCAIIMDPIFEEFGSSLREHPNSSYKLYWTQVFGTH